MNKQQRDAYDWWLENQSRDFDSMSDLERIECCKEQDKLYELAFPLSFPPQSIGVDV